MHGALSHQHPSGPGMPIRGTFYPADGPRGGSTGSALPKILAVLVTAALVRTVIAHAKRHGGPSRWSRRREAIAALHRELHAQDGATDAA